MHHRDTYRHPPVAGAIHCGESLNHFLTEGVATRTTLMETKVPNGVAQGQRVHYRPSKTSSLHIIVVWCDHGHSDGQHFTKNRNSDQMLPISNQINIYIPPCSRKWESGVRYVAGELVRSTRMKRRCSFRGKLSSDKVLHGGCWRHSIFKNLNKSFTGPSSVCVVFGSVAYGTKNPMDRQTVDARCGLGCGQH